MRALYVGHTKALEALPRPVPASVLVTGPEGVGKSLVARDVAFLTGAVGMDLLDFGRLSAPQAKALVAYMSSRPRQGPVKAAVAEITALGGYNTVLKLLEEPPPYARIVLHSSLPVPLTVVSRCFKVQCGTLSDDEVARVLTGQGWDSAAAHDAARLSGGRVSVASTLGLNSARMSMLSVFRAVAADDAVLLDTVVDGMLKTVSPEAAVRVASQALREARSGRPDFYDADEVAPLVRLGADRLDSALRVLASGARSHLAVRTSLTGLL